MLQQRDEFMSIAKLAHRLLIHVQRHPIQEAIVLIQRQAQNQGRMPPFEQLRKIGIVVQKAPRFSID